MNEESNLFVNISPPHNLDKSDFSFYIPEGFAHGFVVLSDTAVFSYKCDNYYMKESERGLIYNDSELNINWQLDKENLKISKKDSVLPNLKDLV